MFSPGCYEGDPGYFHAKKKKKKKRSYLFNSSPSKCIYQEPWNLSPGVGLNPSTIDGWGEGAWRSGRGPQAILEGNHDNPESRTHQALSHWELQWREAQLLTKTESREEGGLGAKNIHKYCRLKQRKQNDWLLWKHCKITKALLNPETDPHTISEEDRWPALSWV